MLGRLWWVNLGLAGVSLLLGARLWTVRRECVAEISILERSLVLTPGKKVLDIRGAENNQASLFRWPASRPVLILHFAASCIHCERNWQAWDRLIHSATERGVDVLFLCNGEAPQGSFIQRHAINAHRMIHNLDPETIQSLRLEATPQTMLVSKNGIILDAKLGELDDKDILAFTKGLNTH